MIRCSGCFTMDLTPVPSGTLDDMRRQIDAQRDTIIDLRGQLERMRGQRDDSIRYANTGESDESVWGPNGDPEGRQ